LINEEIEPNDNNQSTLILTSQKQSEEDILRIVFGMSQIKKIPSKVKKKEYRVQTLDKYILPKLQEWWGGKEKLTSDLLSTNFLRKGLQEHLKSVEEKVQKLYFQRLNVSLDQARQLVITELNSNLRNIAGYLLKGTHISQRIYNQHRFFRIF